MMKILYPLINSEICFDPQVLNVLVIENPAFLVEFVQEIILAQDKFEAKIKFIENGQLTKNMDAVFLITDIFNLDFNNKKFQSIIAKRLLKALQPNEFVLNEHFVKGYNLLADSLVEFDCRIVLNDTLDISQIIKLYSPKIEADYDNTLQKLIAYIDVLVDLLNLKQLIAVGLQDFLEEDEVVQLFEHCRYREVAMLSIQAYCRYNFPFEKRLIIDKDLCEILEKQT